MARDIVVGPPRACLPSKKYDSLLARPAREILLCRLSLLFPRLMPVWPVACIEILDSGEIEEGVRYAGGLKNWIIARLSC